MSAPMLDEHSPELMRVLAPYYDTIGRTDRAASDMDAEFAEAQQGRDREYEQRKVEQQEQRRQYEAAREEVGKKLAEQREQAGESEEEKPNAWLDHRRHEGAEELDFAPQYDSLDDGPVERRAPAPSGRQAVVPSRTAGRGRVDPDGDSGYDDEDEWFMNRSWLQ